MRGLAAKDYTMNYYFLSFDINHKVSNHYTLGIESEEGEIYSSDTWDKSLIDRLELGDPTAEEDAILYVKIQNSLI